jgi:hypothetical protein
MASLPQLNGAGRRDDVFFLILIDFLVQILFFGLFLFVFYEATIQKKNDQLKDAVNAAGVSNLTELTDDLSRLAPLKLKELSDLIAKAGGADAVTELLNRVSEEGGAKTSIARLDKLRKLEGADKPSCLVDPGTHSPRPLMTVLAVGQSIRIVEGSPDLEKLAATLPGKVGVGQAFSPDGFERSFAPLLQRQPQCRYYIKFQERTELVAPRRAAGRVFYLMVR